MHGKAWAWVSCMAALISACDCGSALSRGRHPQDGGPADSGTFADAEPALDGQPSPDAQIGSSDAAPLDALSLDSSSLDATPLDASSLDAAPPFDSGLSCTPSGPALDNARLRAATGTVSEVAVVLTWNGNGYGALFEEEPAAGAHLNTLTFALLDAQGSLLPGSLRLLTPSDGRSHQSPRLVFNGSEYAVAWEGAGGSTTPGNAVFERLTQDGSLIAGSTVFLGTDPWGPAVAYNTLDHEWGVAWNEGNTTTAVHFARISSLGELVAGSETVVAAIPGAQGEIIPYNSHPLIWNGTRYALTWQEYAQPNQGVPRLVEIDRSGAVIASSQTAVGQGPFPNIVGPDLAWNGAEYGLAWEDDRSGSHVPVFARVSSGGGYVAQSQVSLVVPAGIVGGPSIEWSGSEWAVIWIGAGMGAPAHDDVFLARLSSSGALVSTVDLTCRLGFKLWPNLGWSGSRYAVAFTETETPSTLDAWAVFFR
jgi:hypothetical protein